MVDLVDIEDIVDNQGTIIQPLFATVILDVAIDKALDYAIPAEMQGQIHRGTRVQVPLRGGQASGYVLEVKSSSEFNVKPIQEVLAAAELIPADLFDLALWMAKYYCTPLRQVLKTVIPTSIRSNMKHKEQLYVTRNKTREELQALCIEIRNRFPAQAAVLDLMLQVKKGIFLSELLEKTKGSRSPVDSLAKKGFLKMEVVKVDRSPLVDADYFKTKPKALNPQQGAVLQAVNETIRQSDFQTHLLHGITGSGKTEVYLQAIDFALSLGKGVIMLVPEISLTQQTIERFRSRFEGTIAILHHRLSQGERCDEWHKIRRGDAKVVIGARSAVFSPVPNLGLIIVDEEHESSYKQSDEMPCYHARDMAVMRGKLNRSAVILGSATPSLESYYNAQKNKYQLHTLSVRPEAAGLPLVRVVDMNEEFAKTKGFTHFSDTLLRGIKERQERGEQTILFLNRRGYHTLLMCPACRQSVQCQHCDLSLTFHLADHLLSCHLCGFQTQPPNFCPKCQKGIPMKYRGFGTEHVEKALHAVLPGIRSLRMDADTTKHKGSHQRLLRAFATGKADVLIGTQMIAKGLHFPQVTLVGVLNSDASLHIPDFRSSETVFQLLTQVAGRAGRGSTSGEVVIQTSLPANSTIQFAAAQDYVSFYSSEIGVRELFGYPPFSVLAKVLVSGPDLAKSTTAIEQFREQVIALVPPSYEVLPALPSGYARVKDQFRLQFLIRGPSTLVISSALSTALAQSKLASSIKIRFDINPSSTF